MNEKILRLLGLARRSGALTYGITAVKVEIKKARAKLIIIASDISDSSKDDILKCFSNIKVIQIPHTKEEIGYSIGTKPTGILSINDDNFKKGIISNM
jgi:ribosomal protein L7Ae-like RNA K-turn-binding protein